MKSNAIDDEIDVKKDPAKQEKGKKYKSRVNLNDEEKKEKEDNKKSKKNINIKRVITKKKINEAQENKDNNNKNNDNHKNEEESLQEVKQEVEDKPVTTKDENLDETFIVKKNIIEENNLEVGDVNENYYRDSISSVFPMASVESPTKTPKVEDNLEESVSKVIEDFVNEVMTPKAKGNLKEEKVVPLISESVIISERIPRNLIEEKIVIIEKPLKTITNDEVDSDTQNEMI
jgi:flagellar biosynthesis GTPase FlhF